MAQRPGGKLSTRPLQIIWVVDCSGSMAANGKMVALNESIRSALPYIAGAADSNPTADICVRTLCFSNGARWLGERKRLSEFDWVDLDADILVPPSQTAEVIFLIDTSGSMANEIEAVKAKCGEFAHEISRTGASVRLGLVGFDIGGHRGPPQGGYSIETLSEYTLGIWPLQPPDEFKESIADLRLGLLGGGGCFIADLTTVEIFPRVIEMFSGGDGSVQRHLVIVSDELGSTDGVPEITQLLNEAKTTAHVLGVPRLTGAHQTIATATGGRIWDIRSLKGHDAFIDLLNDVASCIGTEVRRKFENGTVSGGSDLGAALRLLAKELTIEAMPLRGFSPVLVLFTDGRPSDDFNVALREFQRAPWTRKAVRVAIGIGADSRLDTLQAFAGADEIPPMVAMNSDLLTRYVRWVSTAVVKSVTSPASEHDPIAVNKNSHAATCPRYIADQFAMAKSW